MKITITENQYNVLDKNLQNDKKKKLLKNQFGLDLEGKIKQINSVYDLPVDYPRYYANEYLNLYGPMYIIDFDGFEILYHNRKPNGLLLLDPNGDYYYESEILKNVGLDNFIFTVDDLINIFFKEEQ